MIKVFNEEAASYDDWYKTDIGNLIDKIETEAFYKLLSKESYKRILDIGCGTGNYTFKLENRSDEIIGCDVSDKMLEKALNKKISLKSKANFIQSSAEKLPFKDEVFDLIISVATFEFIDNKRETFEEAMRCLKKDGEIIIGFLNKTSEWGKLYQSDYFTENTVFKYAKLFSKEEVKEIFGAKPIQINEALFFSPEVSNVEEAIKIELSKPKIEGGFFCAKWKK